MSSYVDFGNTTKQGNKFLAVTDPFYRLKPVGEPDFADPATEQFAIGSCIYNIRTGHEPLDHLSLSEMGKALEKWEFPLTDDDAMFGQIVDNCWHARYSTMAEVESAIISALGDCKCDGATVMEPEIFQARVLECKEFLRKWGKVVEPDGNL